MDLEDVLAKKKENLEKLIRNKDEAIRKEMLQYESAAFYIRLQSECFNLYPVVVEALSLLIVDDKRRAIFCSIVKGHKLESLAAYHNLTPQEAVQEFRSIVHELRRRIKEGALTAKESASIRLLHERNELKNKVRNQDALYKKLQLRYTNLLEQLDSPCDDEESAKYETIARLEKELAISEEVKKELRMELERQAKEQVTKTSNSVSIISRWIRWMRIIYERL